MCTVTHSVFLNDHLYLASELKLIVAHLEYKPGPSAWKKAKVASVFESEPGHRIWDLLLFQGKVLLISETFDHQLDYSEVLLSARGSINPAEPITYQQLSDYIPK